MGSPRVSNRNGKQKELILGKAGDLFWEKGFQNTSMKDIARACGFQTSNTYNYFARKEQILFELIQNDTQGVVNATKHLEQVDSGTPSERLRNFIAIHFRAIAFPTTRTYHMLYDTCLQHLSLRHRKKIIELRDSYDRILRGIIHDGIEAGEFEGIHEKLAGFAIASMILRSRMWFSPKGDKSPEEIAQFMADFVLNGLRRGVRRT